MEEPARRAGDRSPAARAPVLLLGAERSGSTMLGLMLGSHPELAWLGEFEYAVDFLPEEGGLADAEAFRRWLPGDRRFRAQDFALNESLDYQGLVDSFLEQVRCRAGKPLVGAALHRHFDRIPRLWPDARLIHLVRDGRDVALSRIGMGWAGNVWTACWAWKSEEESWSQLRSALRPGSYAEVRFEDLIRCPERELERLCTFLGLSYTPEMLRYPERSGYDRPDPSAAERWRSRIPPRELGFLEDAIGPLLTALGYPPSGVAAKAPGRIDRARLRFQNWRFRIAFRFRRYGWSLVVAEYLARRLRLEALQRRLRLRIDAITRQHLR